MSLWQGALNNLKEVSTEELQKKFGQYLTEGEEIYTGFKLVRDTLIITDMRIIDFDKQGARGLWSRRGRNEDGSAVANTGAGVPRTDRERSWLNPPEGRDSERVGSGRWVRSTSSESRLSGGFHPRASADADTEAPAPQPAGKPASVNPPEGRDSERVGSGRWVRSTSSESRLSGGFHP